MKLVCIVSAFLVLFDVVNANVSTLGRQAATAPACDEVLATWTSSQVLDVLSAGIDRNFGEQAGALKDLALPLVQYGVQVRKVCAVCAVYM